MPTLVEINGLDEAGKVGETIWFVRLGVRIDSELQILLRNLEHFDKLIVRKSDLFGREEKNLMKYARDVIDDPILNISIFRMQLQTQIQVLKEYFGFLCNEMFKARKILIDGLKLAEMSQTVLTQKANESEETPPQNPMWQVVETLQRFEHHPYLCESLVKSYGMMNLTARLDRISDLFKTSLGLGTKRMLVTQIDGGYPFAFWWQKLVRSSHLSNIKKKNVYITGVSHGDCYYPTLSVAGAIAFILNRYPHRASFLPIHEMVYDDRFPMDAEFYDGHTKALNRPTFVNRMIFLGIISPDLMTCLPYCLHRLDRRRTYEPFHIEISSESFFGRYGSGKPENTVVILGKLNTAKHRADVWSCKSKGYECKHLADLKDGFESLCTDISDEIDLLHKEKRAKLSGKFENIRKKCLSEFE